MEFSNETSDIFSGAVLSGNAVLSGSEVLNRTIEIFIGCPNPCEVIILLLQIISAKMSMLNQACIIYRDPDYEYH